MYITFQRNSGAGMPQNLRKASELKTGLHASCGKTVAQSMEMHTFQIAGICIQFHPVLQSSRFQKLLFFTGQNIGIRIIFFPPGAKICNVLIHGNHSCRFSAFWPAGYNSCFFLTDRVQIFQALHGVTHINDFFFQRNISPLQGTEFSDSKSGHKC